jgi:transglutaminase-like putative cysteine protease
VQQAQHDIGCWIGFDVEDDVVLALQVAAAHTAGTVLQETFQVTDGTGATCEVTEMPADLGGRVHVVAAGRGPLQVSYTASLLGSAPPVPAIGTPALAHDVLVGLRPSRYCPSDALAGFAASTFPEEHSPAAIARTVASWVFEHLLLSAGSGPTDSAIDTLLAANGVCRDFAHLTIALCRARGVAARFASVYAPGLSPMDFHAVAEVHTEWGWEVFDATRQAPRSTLLRIATGRDAADAAFVTTIRGHAELTWSQVLAATDGLLPADDHTSPSVLP